MPKNAVVNSICFASSIRLRPSVEETRVSVADTDPSHNPVTLGQATSNPSRLKRVLDSIAMLCVSEPHHQGFAAALRISGSHVELIVAGNDTVDDETITHLDTIWANLQLLSGKYQEYHKRYQVSKTTPPKQPRIKDLPQDVQRIVRRFNITLLMFTIRKLRRRLTKHFARFRALQVDDTHHHIHLYRTVLLLHAYIGDEEAPNIMSSDQWAYLPLILNSLQSRIEKTEDNFQELKSLMPTPFPVQGYLEKITSISQNIKALLNAASSPRLKAIFALSFTVTNLPPITETYQLPTMSDEWDSVIMEILNEKNRTREFSEDECELTKFAWEDAEYVATKGPHNADAPVHCECNIIQHVLKPGQSPIYSYIGVSKLSCRGCWEYIAAVNEVYGARYQTKGTHVKWYYPWGFASISKESQVAAIIFTKIAQKIGRVYPGFRSKTAATQSDSETQSLSPDDEPSSEQEDDDIVERLVEEAGLR